MESLNGFQCFNGYGSMEFNAWTHTKKKNNKITELCVSTIRICVKIYYQEGTHVQNFWTFSKSITFCSACMCERERACKEIIIFGNRIWLHYFVAKFHRWKEECWFSYEKNHSWFLELWFLYSTIISIRPL